MLSFHEGCLRSDFHRPRRFSSEEFLEAESVIKTVFRRILGKRTLQPRIVVPLILTLLFAALTVARPPFLDEHVETLLLDARFRARDIIAPPEVPENIVVVAVDEKSLAEFGRWPWKREIQAELLGKIFEGRPRVVAVDIFYPESESAAADSALAETFEKHRDRLVVALGFEVEPGKRYEGEVEEVLYEHALSKIENYSYLDDFSFQANNVLLPPEPLASSVQFGNVYALSDRDGKIRTEVPYLEYGGEFFPSLALQAARIYKGVPLEDVRVIGGVGVEMGEDLLPTDEVGRFHVNYLGREGTFPYLSAADLLSGRVDPDVLREKIVLLGTSAIATYDQKVTPLSANMPGVEKNATVVANIVTGNYLRKSPTYVDLFLVIVTGVLTLLIYRRQRAIYLGAAYLLLTSLIVSSNLAVFTWLGMRVGLLYPLLTVISGGLFIINYNYFTEERKATKIRAMFSSYVTERVVNELVKNPEMTRLGGERREVTVLFSDIRGFTAYSESRTPEEVVTMLNEYLGAMTEVVFRWEGTLDKFIGDAIVAFWGAPMEQKDHAERAVKCALNMIGRLEELHIKWLSEGREKLGVGIGVNTGEVLVGNIGAEGKKDYTVIGDHVNLGARVESLTKKYGAQILTTEFTMNKIRGLVTSGELYRISIRGLEKVQVKGKEKPVEIFEIVHAGPHGESSIRESQSDTVSRFDEK